MRDLLRSNPLAVLLSALMHVLVVAFMVVWIIRLRFMVCH